MKREQRLRKNNDFRVLYREGVKVRLQGLVLYGRSSGFEVHRMGIVISRKIGSAVVRNRFKRRMRTFFEELKTLPVPCDVVWIATQPQAAQWSFAELQIHVKEGLEKLRKLLGEDVRECARLGSVSKRTRTEADAVY